MKQFLQKRIRLVNTLINEVEGVSYADVVLILTAIISACASNKWPGKGIDRKRFIELLVNNSPPDFLMSWVSVPALINRDLLKESETLYGVPGQETRVFKDAEIDLSFNDARSKHANIPVKELRKHSYASLIYEWLRCGYSHEYYAHGNITQVPASCEKAKVSYIGRYQNGKTIRMVSFHLDYLINIAEYHVSSFSTSNNPPPSQWWVDQG